MNNTFSLEQLERTVDLNAELILRQNRLDKMAKFMEVKSNNPRLKQSETAKVLAISTSTLQRYRRETNMHSPYRLLQSSNTNTRKQKTSNHKTSNDLKKTSIELNETSKESVNSNRKNKLGGGNPNDDSPIQ